MEIQYFPYSLSGFSIEQASTVFQEVSEQIKLLLLTFHRLLATLSPLVQNQKAQHAELVLSHLEMLQLCKRTERSKLTDSLDWSRSFAIFSISRLSLHSSGIPRELV